MGDAGSHLPEEVARFHGQLNRVGVVPPTAYRRNHVAYELVCQVNHVLACLLAENDSTAALVVARGAECLGRLRGRDRPAVERAYFDLVEEYLRMVTRFLARRGVAADVMELIPAEWRG